MKEHIQMHLCAKFHACMIKCTHHPGFSTILLEYDSETSLTLTVSCEQMTLTDSVTRTVTHSPETLLAEMKQKMMINMIVTFLAITCEIVG